MRYLYRNEDGFTIERRLGHTWYYGEIIKSAIEKYALSEAPDYDELKRIVKRIDTYMESGRFVGNLGASIYCTTSYASDILQIRTLILNLDLKLMSKEEIKSFFRIQFKKIDKAYEDYQSSLWTS